jgi:hypothetical protein
MPNTLKKVFLILSLLFLIFCCFSQSKYIPVNIKKIVYARDGGRCQCCGKFDNLEFDHIMPYSCGGGSEVSNIQLLCFNCNRSKSNGCYCKIHNKKVGINCCDRNSNGNQFPGSSNGRERKKSASSQCVGKTNKGARCKKMTLDISGRCHFHSSK